jgi:hypothetical protein
MCSECESCICRYCKNSVCWDSGCPGVVEYNNDYCCLEKYCDYYISKDDDQ